MVFFLALIFTQRPENAVSAYPIKILEYWQTGFWELLAFTMQMALILILGHTLALTPIFNKLIGQLTKFCNTTAQAALIVSLFTILLSFFNWGLCLVFGAIFARKVAERSQQLGKPLNYPLIGAAGYAGMMCWHGGFSASAPLTVSGKDHFLINQIGRIGIDETILSNMNLVTWFCLVILIPLSLYLLGKMVKDKPFNLKADDSVVESDSVVGAEKFDHYKLPAIGLGVIICFIAIRQAFNTPSDAGLGFIDLNYVNFLLFGLGLTFHGTFAKFLKAVQTAVGGSTGIIIQFPLYAGIMGIMKYSGLGAEISYAFVAISNQTTLPIFTFLSAGLVNIFVPSGGGQCGAVDLLHEGGHGEVLGLEVEVERRAGEPRASRDVGDVDLVQRALAQQRVEGLQQSGAPLVADLHDAAPTRAPERARARARPAGISLARRSCS